MVVGYPRGRVACRPMTGEHYQEHVVDPPLVLSDEDQEKVVRLLASKPGEFVWSVVRRRGYFDSAVAHYCNVSPLGALSPACGTQPGVRPVVQQARCCKRCEKVAARI